MKGAIGTGATTASGIVSGNQNSKTFISSPGDRIEEKLNDLIAEHGQFQIWTQDWNVRVDPSRQNPHCHSLLVFEDGYMSVITTELVVGQSQYDTAMSTNEEVKNDIQLNSILRTESGDRQQVERVISSSEFYNSTNVEEPEFEEQQFVSAADIENRSIKTLPINSSKTIENAAKGSKSVNISIPIANSAGANYRVDENICGVTLRSSYLAFSATAKASVYGYVDIGAANEIDAQFAGTVNGAVGNIGMGVGVYLEGYVKKFAVGEGYQDTMSQKIMEINSNLADITDISDQQYGPNNGGITNQDDIRTDVADVDVSDSDYIEVGIRMEATTNGVRAGVGQIDFMPAKKRYQPPGAGSDYSYIKVES